MKSPKSEKKVRLCSTRECFPNPGMRLEFGVNLFTVSLCILFSLGVCPARSDQEAPWVPNGAGPAEALTAVPGPASLGAGVGGQGVKGHRTRYPGLAGAGATRAGHRPGFLAERLLPSHLAAVRLFAPLRRIPEVVFSHNRTRRWTRHICRDSSLRVRGTQQTEERVRGSGPSGQA